MKEYILRGRGPNMMTVESLDELTAFLEDNADSPILIYGEGEAFSSGHDLNAIHLNTPEEITRSTSDVMERLFYHKAPTVAAINGHAVAGGCMLAQACDVRLCSDNPSIRFSLPGVALGITYPPKIERMLQYRLPSHTIDRVLLEAAQHGPEVALRLGLIDEIVPDACKSGRELISQLSSHSPQVYAEAKRHLRAGKLEVSESEVAHHAELFSAQYAAFMNMRK